MIRPSAFQKWLVGSCLLAAVAACHTAAPAESELPAMARLTQNYYFKFADGRIGGFPLGTMDVMKMGNKLIYLMEYPKSNTQYTTDSAGNEVLVSSHTWMQSCWMITDSTSAWLLQFDSSLKKPWQVFDKDSFTKARNLDFQPKVAVDLADFTELNSGTIAGDNGADTLYRRYTYISKATAGVVNHVTLKWCRGQGGPEFGYMNKLKPGGDFRYVGSEERMTDPKRPLARGATTLPVDVYKWLGSKHDSMMVARRPASRASAQ
ncbi:MAG: hypothetical protein MUF62_13650 [Chitinophagaceae bacterium]|nr:hypothetical protein [Chitinophagaceae bacterium]